MFLKPVTPLREKCPNMELFLVRIQSEYWKIQTRYNSVFGLFSRSVSHSIEFSSVFSTICQIHLFQSFTFSWFPRRLLPNRRFKNLSQVITIIRSRRNLERAMLVSKIIEKVMSACIKLLLFSYTGRFSISVLLEKFSYFEDISGKP